MQLEFRTKLSSIITAVNSQARPLFGIKQVSDCAQRKADFDFTHIRLGLRVHFHANILEICWFASKLLQMWEQAALESQELSLFCSVIKHIWCDCKEERILQSLFAPFDWWMVTAMLEMMQQHIKTMRQWAILQKSCRCSLLCVGT